MTLPTGTHLGPYAVRSLLGAGGMGEAYLAWDARLSREVAVKVLPPEAAFDPDRLRRFEHEARAAGALKHPQGQLWSASAASRLRRDKTPCGQVTERKTAVQGGCDRCRHEGSDEVDEQCARATRARATACDIYPPAP
jgi:serine/threonine protein kinase